MKHNSTPPIRLTFSVVSIVFSIALALAAFGVPVNTSWTYQGQLRRSGTGYTGTCNFQFSLWDAASAGTQLATQSLNGVNVVNGLFTVVLDFGSFDFQGDARWLGTSVQCSGDGGSTSLDPRQPLTAAPYALSLRAEAVVSGSNTSSMAPMLNVYNFAPYGGVGIKSTATYGLFGTTISDEGYGVFGQGAGAASAGVFGYNTQGKAVWGQSTGTGPAIFGQNNAGGLAGSFAGPVDIQGKLTVSIADTAIEGTGTIGVHGQSGFSLSNTIGVKGEGTGTNSVGVYGTASGTNTAGVFGRNTSGGTAIWAQGSGSGTSNALFVEAIGGGRAATFNGNVFVNGALVKSSGSFRIDHPLDPANKFLSHSFVESPDMKNIYDGNVTTDATGSASVTLPDYFAALNRDYRYQLTVLGQFAQAIVSRKIAGNTFEIRTDKPGVEVSWQVTGIRQDAYAKEHPIVVEEFKPAEQKGLYLYPAGFGAGEDKRIGHLKGPALGDEAQHASGVAQKDQTEGK